jgi:hypothetical protein
VDALSCLGCGTPTARDGWCPRCLTAAPVEPTPARVAASEMVVTKTGRHTDKTSVSFGPLGRVLWTVAVVVPPIPILWVTLGLAGWGFAGLWWGVVTPWAMRDLWRTSGRRRRVL